MKVIVDYTCSKRKTIDVDDEFYKLSDSGGYETLSDNERNRLTNALLDQVVEKTGAFFHSISSVETEDGEFLVEI